MKFRKCAMPFAVSALAVTAFAAMALPGATSASATTQASPPTQPVTGPGSAKPCNIVQNTTESTANPGRYITIVYPTGSAATPIMGGTCGDGKRPVVAVVHGLAAGDSILYQGIINHEAEVGNIVIFATYQTNPLDFDSSFLMEQTEIETAVKGLTRDDMSRFGLIGHSMGAGAIPYLVEQAAAQGWGTKALFAYSLAPWEIADVTPIVDFDFPSNTRLIVENFTEDVFVSAMTGSAVYGRANIPTNQKIHITLNAQTYGSTSINTPHLVPNSLIYPENVMHFYGIFRNADLLQTCSVDNSVCNFNAMSFMGDWSDGTPFTPATLANS